MKGNEANDSSYLSLKLLLFFHIEFTFSVLFIYVMCYEGGNSLTTEDKRITIGLYQKYSSSLERLRISYMTGLLGYCSGLRDIYFLGKHPPKPSMEMVYETMFHSLYGMEFKGTVLRSNRVTQNGTRLLFFTFITARRPDQKRATT